MKFIQQSRHVFDAVLGSSTLWMVALTHIPLLQEGKVTPTLAEFGQK